jgi:hypothetical protein
MMITCEVSRNYGSTESMVCLSLSQHCIYNYVLQHGWLPQGEYYDSKLGYQFAHSQTMDH